jgi:transposase
MAVQQSGTTAATVGRRVRRLRTKQERRQIVEETLKAGGSVSLVARAHDVNANQVFKWRKQYREGRLDVEPNSSAAKTLLPIKISDALRTVRRTATGRVKPRRPGIIDIDLGHARVRIEGAADPDCVRAALEGLRQ